MAKKQWGTTYEEETLKEFQKMCEQYGLKANLVLEALMKFFSEGNCKIVISQNGLTIETQGKEQ